MTPPISHRFLIGDFWGCSSDCREYTGNRTANRCIGGVMTPPYDVY